MLKRVLWASALVVVILVVAIVLTYDARKILFTQTAWWIAGVTALGFLWGVFRGIRHNADMRRQDRQPDRHTLDSFLEHWVTALGILTLTISGFFIQTQYRRGFSTNLHFLGLMITLFFGTYFLADFFVAGKYRYLFPGIQDVYNGTIRKYLFRKTWRETGKYLSSQKSAFLAFVVVGIVMAATGALKVAVFYFSLPGQVIHIATQLHDLFARIFAVLLVVHIFFAVIVPSHRRLLLSLFTGKLKQPPPSD